MYKGLYSIVIALVTLFAPLLAVNAQDCTFSMNGSSQGDCFDVTMSFSCDDGVSCVINYGGCDWGDVSVIYYHGTCDDS